MRAPRGQSTAKLRPYRRICDLTLLCGGWREAMRKKLCWPCRGSSALCRWTGGKLSFVTGRFWPIPLKNSI